MTKYQLCEKIANFFKANFDLIFFLKYKIALDGKIDSDKKNQSIQTPTFHFKFLFIHVCTYMYLINLQKAFDLRIQRP